jgi:hypothetical protein
MPLIAAMSISSLDGNLLFDDGCDISFFLDAPNIDNTRRLVRRAIRYNNNNGITTKSVANLISKTIINLNNNGTASAKVLINVPSLFTGVYDSVGTFAASIDVVAGSEVDVDATVEGTDSWSLASRVPKTHVRARYEIRRACRMDDILGDGDDDDDEYNNGNDIRVKPQIVASIEKQLASSRLCTNTSTAKNILSHNSLLLFVIIFSIFDIVDVIERR